MGDILMRSCFWAAVKLTTALGPTQSGSTPAARPVTRKAARQRFGQKTERKAPCRRSDPVARGPGEMMGDAGPGMLAGLRVIEIADERAEYAGLLLAGLGAEVVKIEPPEGSATRRIGPFLDDVPARSARCYFWNYNRNKKSVVLDLREADSREQLLRLLGRRRRAARRELRRA